MASYAEAGQTFEQFRSLHFSRPNQTRDTIYLQPIGAFGHTAPSLTLLRKYAEIFFGMPVVVLTSIPEGAKAIRSRHHPKWHIYQILSEDIVGQLNQKKQGDAYATLGVTMTDLFSRQTTNYVFGLASLVHQTGVFSFARYSPAFYGKPTNKETPTLVLRRSLQVMSHELGHMFGIRHCTHYACLMNGANHLEEADSQPLTLCPVCLRKMKYQVGFDALKRYEALNDFYERHRFERELAFTRCRLSELNTGDDTK